MIAFSHVIGILHNSYFCVVEVLALFKQKRDTPEFDEELNVRPFNCAILSGATDIIAVARQNGDIALSEFHVRFGWSSGVFRGGDFVDVYVEDKKFDQQMKIGSNGIAHFVNVADAAEMFKTYLSKSSKESFNIRFAPKVTLWGKEITRFISYFVTVELHAQLYLWKHTDKVVICDIDGTITRTDAAGHIYFWARKLSLPLLSSIGFTHPHVVDLLNCISKNNYKFMFLTARNIGYAAQVRACLASNNSFRLFSRPFPQTKSYIQGTFTENSEEKKLPQGPVITSHSGVLAALWLEIFLKRPDEFKINELDYIRKLFMPSERPFFAGFGNRPTDSRSYCAVGMFRQPTATLLAS